MTATRRLPPAAEALARVQARQARWAAEHPLLLQLVWLFVFFLPLLSVQIPSIIAGFSINPARLLIVLAVVVVLATKALHPESRPLLPEPLGTGNPALRRLLAYFALSLFYYYALLAFDSGVLFGSSEPFFRSWRGRPLAQFVSLLTYAVVPYLLVRRYAREPRRHRLLGGALVAATVLLVWYGYVQQVSYYLGLPVTGRLLYEGAGLEQRVPAYTVQGLHLLRFYSLGGEPRDYGTFIIGATLFFVAWAFGTERRFVRPTVVALVVSFFLTASTSALLTLAIIGAIVLVDATVQGWIRVATVVRVAVVLGLLGVIVVFTNAGALLGDRTVQYWKALQTLGAHRAEVAFLLQAQSTDLGALFYVIDLPKLPLHRLLFGFGFGNYSSGMGDILLRYFDYDIMREGTLEEPRAYMVKLIVETGLVGVGLFVALFVRTLRTSRRLLAVAATREERTRQVALRYSYVAFFVAGMVQVSFYHFIIMGLIESAANLRARSMTDL